MLDVILDGIIDTIKLIPFLFVAFLILELIEHKLDKKNTKILENSQKVGPLLGGLLGVIPQCGFSAMATNLFSKKVITMGTLIAIYLSTSDEMLPLLLSHGENYLLIIKILCFKLIIGIFIGFLIDLLFHPMRKNQNKEIHLMCTCENCHCEEEGVVRASIIHTLKITFFILMANIIINILIYYIGEENLTSFITKGNFLSYIVASLFGLIPNCASSVVITELYLNNVLSLGSMLAGLLTCSGVGILILFKENKNLRENISILSIIYFSGVLLGFLVDLLGK